MKKALLIISFAFISIASKAVRITIIESQSYNIGHNMDQNWLTLAGTLGYTASIYPQTTLDNNSFFATTDILIVSSGIIPLPANRVNTILQYLQQGGKVYLQSEYLMSFDTDIAFQYLVNTLGGSFKWTANISGNLFPMNALGSLATTPNTVNPLTYYWYGVAGKGCANVEPFIQYAGNNFGFIFCPPVAGIGKLITTTDQDWIRQGGVDESRLMQNILFNLLNTSYQCISTGNYPFSLNLGHDTTLCTGNTINLHAGPGFSAYQWQNGSTDSVQTVSNSGLYWVTATNPCSSFSDSINISIISCVAAPVAHFTSSDTAFCTEGGQCIDFFDHSTGSPTSWIWYFPGSGKDTSQAQNPKHICYTNPGTYVVKLVVYNSGGSDSLTITPHIIFGTTPDPPSISIVGDSLKTTASGVAYQWFKDSQPIINAIDSFYVISDTGYYALQITDSLGCSSRSTAIHVVITSTSNLQNNGMITIYPNPVADKLEVRSLNSEAINNWEVNNIVGEKVSSNEYINGAKPLSAFIDVSVLSNGIYFLQLNLNGHVTRTKFVVVHR